MNKNEYTRLAQQHDLDDLDDLELYDDERKEPSVQTETSWEIARKRKKVQKRPPRPGKEVSETVLRREVP